MKRLHIKTRFGSCILHFALCICLIVLSGCGSGTSDDTSSDTGSIAFSVVFQGAPSESKVLQAQSPSGDVCEDYAIETVRADVYNSSNAVVASGNWPCSTPGHVGTISGVPTGSGMYVIVEGIVSGNPDWQGQSAPFSVSAGQTTDAGTVTMNYEGSDTTLPTVDSTNPTSGATDVPINTAITATFSEAVVSASVNTSTFTLGTDTTTVPGSVTYDPSSWIAIFKPNNNLSYSTPYTATITADVEDMAANHMTADYTWSFTTGSALDTTPPTVSSTSPPNGETDVAVNTAITATFSEAMDPSTINTASFFVNDGSTNIAGQVAYSGTTATFTPTTNLDYSATYTATITTGAEDLAGNALEADYTWSFTTGTVSIPKLTWDVQNWDEANWN